MQWNAVTAGIGLVPGAAFRFHLPMNQHNAPLPVLSGGDMVNLEKIGGGWSTRADVVQAYENWAILKDSNGDCWRVVQHVAGQLVTPGTFPFPYQDWNIDSQVQCPGNSADESKIT